jgi:hypothetical protein
MPKTAATKKQDLKAKPDHYIECRQNHRWERLGFFHFRATHGKGICKKSLCERCDTIRYQWYEADGTRLWTEYEYPDHYLLVGEGKVTPKDVRQESMRRSVIHTSEEALDASIAVAAPRGSRKAV